MKPMLAVPFARWKFRGSDTRYYTTPTRESWSLTAMTVGVGEEATAEDVLDAWRATLSLIEDEDERFQAGDWVLDYADRITGFALVTHETYALIEDVHTLTERDGHDDVIADFKVAFCVDHAERILLLDKSKVK